MATEWVIRPTAQIVPNIARIRAALLPAVTAIASAHAAIGQGMMQGGAPWTDRTGYARASLYGRPEGTDIVLGTSNSEYGLYLELGTSKMAARPIIAPTAQQLAPIYFGAAMQAVSAVIGGAGAY